VSERLAEIADKAFKLLSELHDLIPTGQAANKGAAFAAMNDVAALARRLRNADTGDRWHHRAGMTGTFED